MFEVSFRCRKEQENKVHEVLYKNVSLLSHFYPPSADLKSVLKPDMFVKNNKTAFFEISYYLLNIYDPDTKEKVKSWPPLTPQREKQFRNEILNCIAEINVTCDYADIPIPMASHLIAPGGIRFARFILKISEIAVHKHLLRTGCIDILNRQKLSKSENLTKAVMKNLRKETEHIDNQTSKMLNDFETAFNNNLEKASKITESLTNLDKIICRAKTEYALSEIEFNTKYASYPSFESLEEKLRLLRLKSDDIAELKTIFCECNRLMVNLNDSKFLLEHNNSFQTISDQELRILSDKTELNLVEFFRCLKNFMERQTLRFCAPTEAFIEKSKQQIDNLTKHYQSLAKKYEEAISDLGNLVEEIQRMFENVVMNAPTSTVLTSD